jgi:hypothetical protein
MPLTVAQIKEILKAPKNKAVLSRAISHEQRLQFHTEIALDRQRTSPYINVFLRDVEHRLQPDKFRNFLSLFGFPVKTVQDTDKIYDAIGKVWDGQNPVYKYEFLSSEYADDWSEYSKDYTARWRKEAMEAMKLHINSIVICDLPAVQTGSLPEPYYYFLDISHVIDFSSPDGCSFDWIIFRKNPKEIVVIDSDAYTVFKWEQNETLDKLKLISQSPHDLTYCPARFFWSESASKADPYIKISPISTHLDELDYLLYLLISKRIADNYATYPIMWAFQSECDYEHQGENGYYAKCDHGFLFDAGTKVLTDQNGKQLPCPKCGHKNLTGPGTKISVPIPTGDNVDLRPPAGFIQTDVPVLEFIVSEIERLQLKLQRDITGYSPDPVNNKAINEKQVNSMIEEPTTILRQIKKPLELIREWTDTTLCKLRYADRFISCSIDMGTDFYLYDADLLLALYNDAKTKQLSDGILDMLMDLYYATKFRNNPDQLHEYVILRNIHPGWHMSHTQALTYYQAQIISKEDLIIILKFSTFVLQFKREQASLPDFGRNLDFSTRVTKIKDIFYTYAGTAIKSGQFYVPEPINQTAVG